MTPGVITGDNSTARLDLENEPQPDALLLIDPEHGGQAQISADDYVELAPELVGESASSSVSFGLHGKLESYRRNGVKEYIVWRVLDHDIDWFVLRGDVYEKLAPDAEGLLRSTVFPGLWLDATAMVQGDLARVLAVVHMGTASPEHAEFVRRLNTAK
jgi:Uma2 family endonuclease